MHPATAPTPEDLAELAVELATGAAEVVQAARGRQLHVSTKSTDTDLVTAADKASEAWLRDQIGRRRPHDAVLGEEGGEHSGPDGPAGADGTGRSDTGAAVRWVVDPIDGTVNFVLGLPQYSVSVAAQVAGRTVAGAVCNPVSGELFHAHLGGGAFLGEGRLSGPRDVPLSRAVVGTGFGYDAGVRAAQAAVVAALLPRVADIRRLGSAALDLCAVAAGRLDAYFESGLHPWDYAAGLLIATEAGCVAGGLRGRPAGTHFTAVAGAGLAAELTATLEALGADTAR